MHLIAVKSDNFTTRTDLIPKFYHRRHTVTSRHIRMQNHDVAVTDPRGHTLAVHSQTKSAGISPGYRAAIDKLTDTFFIDLGHHRPDGRL